MLIPFTTLVRKYILKIKGIFHVGAHECEEKRDYEKHKITNVYWIEAMEDKVQMMKKRYKNINIYQDVISDVDGKEVTFNVSNNGQSSSILELGTHKEKHPQVHYIRQEKHLTKTLNTLIDEEKIDMDNVNFLNLDIQGNELRALKGMEKHLNKVDYIYTEVNVDYLYVDCCLLKELDEYLGKFGFKRVETSMCRNTGWGDAFYIKGC